MKLSTPNLSVNSTVLILQNDDTCNVISCQEGLSGGELDDLISANEGDFLENEPPQADQVRGRLRAHLHSWEKIGATEPVLSIHIVYMYIYISSGGQLHMKIKFFPVGTLFALYFYSSSVCK